MFGSFRIPKIDAFGRLPYPYCNVIKLTASDPTAAGQDRFGYSVALEGNTLMVGALKGAGEVYVFTGSGKNWRTPPVKLGKPPLVDSGFGVSVALSGNNALVGASGTCCSNGTAYVYTGSGLNWYWWATLIAEDGAGSDAFGSSVALDGNTAVVGAYMKDGRKGAAYVFTRSNTGWSRGVRLALLEPLISGDYFGWSVALSGDTVLVGAHGKKAAYIFTRTGATWSQQAKLTVNDPSIIDLGYSVALSADTALVGAPKHDRTLGGEVYAFTGSGANWSPPTKLVPVTGGTSPDFGYCIALNGDKALFGARTEPFAPGKAYTFIGSGTNWTPDKTFRANDDVDISGFGFSGALRSDLHTAVVGDISQNNYNGAVYLYYPVEKPQLRPL